MPGKKKAFVFNDETQENSYGFSIPNNGIDTSYFEANPVMLDSHSNDTGHVIGRWENVRIANTQFIGDAVFDTDDADAAKIAGKVERGFLNAVSMGLGFFMEDLKYVAGKLFLTKCVLKEVSIVAVPANAKALRLYNMATGQLIDERELKLKLTDISSQNFKTDHIHMNKFMLSAAALIALGMASQPADEGTLDAAIVKLKGDLEAEKAGRLADKTALEARAAAAETKLANTLAEQNKALLDAAIADGKITEQERATFSALPTDVMVSMLAKLPGKVVLGGLVTGKANTGGAAPATFEELMALSDSEKAALKASNPVLYNKLLA